MPASSPLWSFLCGLSTILLAYASPPANKQLTAPAAATQHAYQKWGEPSLFFSPPRWFTLSCCCNTKTAVKNYLLTNNELNALYANNKRPEETVGESVLGGGSLYPLLHNPKSFLGKNPRQLCKTLHFEEEAYQRHCAIAVVAALCENTPPHLRSYEACQQAVLAVAPALPNDIVNLILQYLSFVSLDSYQKEALLKVVEAESHSSCSSTSKRVFWTGSLDARKRRLNQYKKQLTAYRLPRPSITLLFHLSKAPTKLAKLKEVSYVLLKVVAIEAKKAYKATQEWPTNRCSQGALLAVGAAAASLYCTGLLYAWAHPLA